MMDSTSTWFDGTPSKSARELATLALKTSPAATADCKGRPWMLMLNSTCAPRLAGAGDAEAGLPVKEGDGPREAVAVPELVAVDVVVPVALLVDAAVPDAVTDADEENVAALEIDAVAELEGSLDAFALLVAAADRDAVVEDCALLEDLDVPVAVAEDSALLVDAAVLEADEEDDALLDAVAEGDALADAVSEDDALADPVEDDDALPDAVAVDTAVELAVLVGVEVGRKRPPAESSKSSSTQSPVRLSIRSAAAVCIDDGADSTAR